MGATTKGRFVCGFLRKVSGLINVSPVKGEFISCRKGGAFPGFAVENSFMSKRNTLG